MSKPKRLVYIGIFLDTASMATLEELAELARPVSHHVTLWHKSDGEAPLEGLTFGERVELEVYAKANDGQAHALGVAFSPWCNPEPGPNAYGFPGDCVGAPECLAANLADAEARDIRQPRILHVTVSLAEGAKASHSKALEYSKLLDGERFYLVGDLGWADQRGDVHYTAPLVAV